MQKESPTTYSLAPPDAEVASSSGNHAGYRSTAHGPSCPSTFQVSKPRVSVEQVRGSKSRRDTTPVRPSHDIALVISDLHGGGAQRVLTALAADWTTRGLRLCAITLSQRCSDKFTLHPDVTRVALNVAARSESTARAVIANLRRMYALRRAILHANAPVVVSFIATTNVITILASVGLKARIVACERNDPRLQLLNRPWESLRRFSYRYADAVTANSRGALQTLESYVPRRKLFFVPNPVRPTAVSVRESRRRQTILNVGRLTYQKAHDILLQAYAQVVAKIPNWNLAIVGEGPRSQRLRDQASSLGLLEHIEWVGWTTEIEQYYESAQLFVLPSRYEGMPNALLEAMSFGLPPIVSDASPGPLEHIAHEENGLVVPVGDTRRLANAIIRLIENPELRYQLGSAAQAKISGMEQGAVDQAWSCVFGLSVPGFDQQGPRQEMRTD